MASAPGQNATVEEILASIRQAISEDDAKRTVARRSEPRSLSGRPAAGVTPVFEDAQEEPESAPDAVLDQDEDATDEAPPADPVDQNVIELAIEQALVGVKAEFDERRPLSARLRPPRQELVRTPQRPIPRAPRMAAAVSRQPEPVERALISVHADAEVSASFDELAKAMIEGNSSKLDAVVEDLLRPMLKTWLESNLPQMVERLVREEIERVARGRR